MKITGVAPKIAVPTFIYLIGMAFIDYYNRPSFNITLDQESSLLIIGILLVVAGVFIVANVGRKLLKSFNNNLLMKDGLFKIFRNPMYAAYLLFIIPGLSLILNSWLVLTTIILNYLIFSAVIKGEYKYLEEKFGEEYKGYLKTVWIKFL
jgi:protein-S-isoprenylcysteine O-methyltransferase Ste14